MDIEKIIDIVKTYKYKRYIMKVIEYVLCNDVNKLNKIKKYLGYNYSNYNKVDYFFITRPTKELRSIFNMVMEKHQIRLMKTSAYIDDRIKDIELRIISFLEYIQIYISKNKFKIDKNTNEVNINNLDKNTNENDIIVCFLRNASNEDIYNLVLSYGRDSNYDNAKVKSKIGKHHQARQHINVSIRFLIDLCDICVSHVYIRGLKTKNFLCMIENKSELLDWDKRRVYNDKEIDDMLEIVKDDIKDKLMITVLREIGLRNSAICNLKFRDIIDIQRYPKHQCRVKEKGNVYREFITSSNIKRMIVTYLHELEKYHTIDLMDKYVFGRSLDKKMCSATLNNVLKRIAIKAGITNVNVQAHSFRHTLVGKLMDAGNNIETVSKFIGHSSVDTTMTYYWLKNISDLANEINNPFLKVVLTEKEQKEEALDREEMMDKKIDTCFQIIGIYKDEINKAKSIDELKKNLKKYDYDIDKILKFIADSSCGSSNLES